MKTPEGVEGLLIGTYDKLSGDGNWNASSMLDWVWGSMSSDDAYKGESGSSPLSLSNIERYSPIASDRNYSHRWRVCYDGVNRANTTLEFLQETQEGDNPISDDRAMEIEAEAKFLRAYYHFKATILWEKIPYIKTEEEMGMKPEEVPNDSEGWDEIEADLQFAIDNLDDTPPKGDVGRVDKWAAKAFKARVHMMQNELSEARPLLDDIINGPFELADHYYDNYNSAKENNSESIFEIQASKTEFGGPLQANHLGPMGPVWPYGGPAPTGWGFFQPSKDLFKAYQTVEGLPVLDKEDREELATDMGISNSEEFHPTDHPLDPRVDWTIMRRGIDYMGWGIHTGSDWIRSPSTGGPMMTKKYTLLKENEEHLFGGGFASAQNWQVFRLSHILLWRAEIHVENNEFDEARHLVNQIRQRAQNTDPVMGRVTTYVFRAPPSDENIDWDQPAANYDIELYPEGADAFSTKEKARKAVRLEQRLEFATEGLRFFDLRRWGIADEVLNDFIEDDVTYRNFMQDAHFDAEVNDYWPLPEGQLDIQEGVLEQDPAFR